MISSEIIERYKKKVHRKLEYFRRFSKFFKLEELEHSLKTLEEDLGRLQEEDSLEMKEFFYESQNKKLKVMKRKLENEYLNCYSNIRAFHVKAYLKGIPLVLILDKHLLKQETKANFPEFMDINARIYEFPQDILALEVQRVLAQNKLSSDISIESISNFVGTVLKNYHAVAYHNFSHAFSVMQVFYFMVKRSPQISNFLNEETFFGGLVSCICHDLSHRKSN